MAIETGGMITAPQRQLRNPRRMKRHIVEDLIRIVNLKITYAIVPLQSIVLTQTNNTMGWEENRNSRLNWASKAFGD